LSKKTVKEECEKADKNPGCPYITDIVKLKTDVVWLKKGYWLQVLISIGTFLTVLGLVIKLVLGE